MSQLLGPETFEFFARYLLAGYIVIIVRARFVVGLRPKPSELIVEAVIFSLIIQLIAQILYVIVGSIANVLNVSNTIAVDPQLLFLGEVLALPALFGAVLGVNLTAGWKNALLWRLSLPVIHPVQRAYDYAFGFERDPSFVLVTFHDDTTVAGYFGQSSLASSDPGNSDIYLERLYVVDTDGNWTEPDVPRSALLSMKDVRSVEFLSTGET